MKQQLLDYLSSDKHNYHPLISLINKFGECVDVLNELVNESMIVERPGVNQKLYKLK